jgi:very-short-patch-repair endonuclease
MPPDAVSAPPTPTEREDAAEAARSNAVTLTVGLQGAANAALWANHVPLLSELSLVNDGAEPLGDVTINLEAVPPAIAPKTWRLGAVGAGQVRALRDLDLALDGPWISSLTEGVRGAITFTVRTGDCVVAEERRDLRLLAHNEWGGSAQISDLLAAFVEPNDPAVPRILRKASDLLRAQGKPDGIEGYQATSKARLWEQINAIWSAVCSLDIRYVNPPPSFEKTGQRIRPPRQIMEERLGTCLDLAVLFAACIEHAGMRPLIVLTKGHAFAGAWLSRHDFGTSVADDAPGLRTRLALDDLLLFETTLCCQSPAPGFRRACAAGAEQVAAGRDAEFDGVIDVHRARQRRILPLGAASGAYARAPQSGAPDAAEPPAAGPPPIEEAPALREDVEAGEREPPPATPAGRLARWRKRLLDLSGRNRLLNLRLGGRQALAVDCPDAGHLEDLLAEMRGRSKAAPLRFRPWPDLMSGGDPRSARLHRDRLNEDAGRAFAKEALAKRELLVGRDEEQLQTALTEIYRAARAAQQEGGANTLFLTIGALLWRPKGKDKPYRAPLILVPVVLDRPSVRSGFLLRAHDDETRVNSTLLELLRQEFDMRLPGLDEAVPEDGSGLDVSAILDAFRRKARDVPGWEVTEEVALTNLSFTKYLMWKDLADRADALRESEVARRLMDGPAQAGEDTQERSASGPGPREHTGGTADEEPMAADLACPMEADSSQLRAVAAAARGKSFVLIGPPGTGKSQTITNIIANTLAQRRSVLFVAEKRAALEVVQRRLRQVGLGDFCLDLFSAKASKVAVLEQLNRAQQVRETADEEGWKRSAGEAAELRAELNGYVRELHRRGRNGWTAYRAIGCLLRAEAGGVPELAIGWGDADAHDAGGYQKLLEAVEEAAATLARLGDGTARTPLSGIEEVEWSPAWQARLVEASLGAAAALDALRAATAPAMRALALPFGASATQAGLAGLDTLAELVLDPAAPAAAWALADGAGDAREPLEAGMALAAERARLAAPIAGRWRATAAALPLEALLSDWRQASSRWLVPRLSGQKAVRARLMPCAAGEVSKDPSADLEALIAIKAKDGELTALGVGLQPLLGQRWRGHETDFAGLGAALDRARRIRAAAAACAPDPVALLGLREHLRRLLGDGADLLGETGAIALPLRLYREAYARAGAALDTLAPLCGRDPRTSPASDDEWPEALAARLRGWADGARHLRDWCAWRGVAQRAETLGLLPMLSAMEAGIVAPSDAARVFEANYARWWVGVAVEDLPRLRGFVAARHEERIKRFRALDARLVELAALLCRARVASGIPDGGARQKSAEYTLLARELAKRQRHIPVRQLMGRMPQAIRRLTPCLMMSPMSVAQYLPADAAAFDLVVFDEASQIPTWDAIGAVGRGRQVIVVGDPKQLPPTRFFERQVPEPEEGEGERTEVDTEDLESILDECLGAGVPSIELTWHYRSRHEGLIAFSNHTYYGGRLVTFPSPVVRDSAVSYRHVPDGVYARAGARTNQVEARAVVAEVAGRLRGAAGSGREPSVGVVTFNAEQQALIEDLLDKARRDEPDLERFFSDDHPEQVLVKNLGGVQGEERDIVIFSLTYGPDVTGRVAMNFGPLNQSGGERRLNVAVTRAREALIVFGSLRPEHIDLSRTSAIGVVHLKQFLTFAEHGARAFAVSATGPLGDFESPFEAAVAERLRARGWVVHPQIGVSGFRVDLGVVDPDAPGAFLAGVECDGATYHRAASARDRDRLRQAVLEGLGWRVLRVWSTDWWTNAGREADRLHAALDALLRESRAHRAAASVAAGAEGAEARAPEVGEGDATGESEAAGSRDAAADTAELPTEALEGLDPVRFYDADYRPRLAALVDTFLRAEAPVRDERLAQRVARAHGFQRTGRRIKAAVLAVLPDACATTHEVDAVFVWPPGVTPTSWSAFRAPRPGALREPAEMSIEELVVLARRVLPGAQSDEVALVQMRDACGLAALREAARVRCLAAIQRARAVAP